jgi:hypothetical protein
MVGMIFGEIAGIVTKFGISSFVSNATTTMITKSGNKMIDKVGIGLGGAIITGMTVSAANKYIKKSINDINKSISPCDDKDAKLINDVEKALEQNDEIDPKVMEEFIEKMNERLEEIRNKEEKENGGEISE